MNDADDTIRVFIPLEFRKRNGRPKILPPEAEPGFQARSQDAHILRAVGRAWAWRRRLESGEAATLQDIARAEKVTDRYVSRIMRLAYLSPEVLERLVIWRVAPSVTVNELAKAASLAWAEQVGRVYAYNPLCSAVIFQPGHKAVRQTINKTLQVKGYAGVSSENRIALIANVLAEAE